MNTQILKYQLPTHSKNVLGMNRYYTKVNLNKPVKWMMMGYIHSDIIILFVIRLFFVT